VSNSTYNKWLSGLSEAELKDIDKVIAELPHDDHLWREIPCLKARIYYQLGLKCPRCGSRIRFGEEAYLLSCAELTMDNALS